MNIDKTQIINNLRRKKTTNKCMPNYSCIHQIPYNKRVSDFAICFQERYKHQSTPNVQLINI